MSSNTIRSFNVKDDTLITLAGVARSHYLKYKMFFTGFNPAIFTEGYEDEILARMIDEAHATTSDEFFVSHQAKETDTVQKAKKSLLRELKILSFCVMDQYRDDPVVLNEFQLDNLSRKSRNVDTFIGFAKDVLVTADTYKEGLLKSGMTAEGLVRIANAGDTLDFHRREQVEMMKSRPGVTQDRIEKVNALWRELSKMSKAANIIFFNNPEISALFALPRSVRRTSKVVEEEHQEEVAA